ncbi:FIG00459097: hypothetical protein [hydrothermal vent metagenome]|uniref:GmrSD restriction endonucleases N-terminal domain-containing protein n=1 Tax=hydrothermal vent metagenome TaxID=652676 RepID=A0A3B1BIH6_9ZZZZ
MSKAEASVEELVGMIERGELRLPEMQRRYVWRATRVRDLLDSLYRGYPSGAILVWETSEDIPLRKFSVEQSHNPYANSKLLLDGQQRLTSLSAVMRGEPISVRGRKRPIDILFNLEHPDELTIVTEVREDSDEEDGEDTTDASEDELLKRFDQMTFVVASKRLARSPNWISVTEVFKMDSDAPFLKKAGVSGFDDPRYDKYSERLKKLRSIRKYMYNMHVLERHLTYEEVTEIFVRVNSLGAKLRSSDLALAQITAKWRNALSIFDELQEECEETGFNLDTGILVKNLVAFITGQSRFNTVASLSLEQLQDGWKEAKEGMQFALNFLKSNARLDSLALLSSPFLIITLAYYGRKYNYQLTHKQEAEIKYWLYVANTRGRYSRGSTETILDQDLSAIDKDKDTDGLISSLRQQFGRLELETSDLEGRNQRSGIFKTMFLVFREDGAKDWHSNLLISLSHQGRQHRLQFHHTFPKAVLKDRYRPTEINDIANLAFIGGKTNRKISSKRPADYIPDVIKKQGTVPFDKQCIPTDEGLLSLEKYPEFLAERRMWIIDRLNKFLEDTRDGR